MKPPNEKAICRFCQKVIREDLVHCPYCHMPAHKAELQRWILRYRKCPRCGRELKPYAC
ncbi:MAG: hypothetical protein ACTSRS_13970 [Candidatus Helarchaeota archaeon]